ncbi:cytosolic phospholipase A2 gamma-like isoform X2 [Hoplias malabaricus]
MVGLLGSLSQLSEEGLLNCIMYLSGVSGSTWCMTSLYKEPEWSTKMSHMKEDIIHRLAHGDICWDEMYQKLKKYWELPNFSLTDVWAALLVSYTVKEIDEHKLTEQRGHFIKDPYPIYTVIDKQCKFKELKADPWFEITPDESGYSLTGAFVNTLCFGSQFENGRMIQEQPEIDMLYLQGLCGSAFAERWEAAKEILEALIKLLENLIKCDKTEHQDASTVLSTLLHLNLCSLNEEDPSVHCKTMNDLMKDKYNEIGEPFFPVFSEKSEWTENRTYTKNCTLKVCKHFFDWFGSCFPLEVIVTCIEKCITWTWGTTYNYLNKMTVEDVDPSVLSSYTREYEDSGLLLNSPYFSVLRKERDIDLIISFDFSSRDQFKTVEDAAKICKDLDIPFPKVDITHRDPPQDFYVFQGSRKVPTVIHIPLFNCINCNGHVTEWEDKYASYKLHYSEKMITDLCDKAGLNIINNKEKLLKVIENIIEEKKSCKTE